MTFSFSLASLKQKAKVAVLAIGGFIASVSNSAIDYYQVQTQQLEEIVDATQAELEKAQDSVEEHISKATETAKEKLKPAKEAVKKAAKKVDSWGCKIGSKKDPRCSGSAAGQQQSTKPLKIYPLSQELEDLSRK